MISEQQEVARYRVAEQVRAAEARAHRSDRQPRGGPRKGLAAALRRLADKLEPVRSTSDSFNQPLPGPQPRHRGTGLSIVR
ncbi:hypothetical protein GCM10009804_00870 [Kribbella hippodromi]|uniref:Uncharacterized protein n=1 Tax=Kribbella hippodromi TaxID=434347 RepID=A0ABN2C028_9ACTN